MALQGQNGHSASVAAYLIVGGQHVEVAKINGEYLTLADSCELAPNTEAQLNVIIDHKKSTQAILLNEGVVVGQNNVRYSALTSF